MKIFVLSFKRSCLPESIEEDLRCSVWDFSKGQPYEEKELSIAIVGSRYPTTYGFEISKSSQKELAQQGVQIVSGLARGVDGTVHREIIDKKGQAVGVLGCGIDLIYPKKIFSYFMTCMRIRQLFLSIRQAVNRSNGIFQKGTGSSVD